MAMSLRCQWSHWLRPCNKHADHLGAQHVRAAMWTQQLPRREHHNFHKLGAAGSFYWQQRARTIRGLFGQSGDSTHHRASSQGVVSTSVALEELIYAVRHVISIHAMLQRLGVYGDELGPEDAKLGILLLCHNCVVRSIRRHVCAGVLRTSS